VELARAWGSSRARAKDGEWIGPAADYQGRSALRVIPYDAMGVQSSAVARRDVVRVLWFTAEQ